jgi:hypothetical protein
MTQITLNGTCVLQIMKDENGKFSHAQILQVTEKGLSPVCDFSVTLLQENQQIGIEFEFDSDSIFSELSRTENTKEYSFLQEYLNLKPTIENHSERIAHKDGVFNSYFINKDDGLLNQINELRAFFINKYNPVNRQQLNDYRERLIALLANDYNWLCVEYQNISKLIEENNAAIGADPDHKNDNLYSKSYDFYHFDKYFLRAPYSLLTIASKYQFIFGENFSRCLDEYKSRNKKILDLTTPCTLII